MPTEENVLEAVFPYVLVVPDEKERCKHNAEFDEQQDAEHPDHKPNFVFVHHGRQASKNMAPIVQTVVAKKSALIERFQSKLTVPFRYPLAKRLFEYC